MRFSHAVSGTRPLIRLLVRGTQGREQSVDFLVDTGFDGSVLLPESIVQALQLTPRNTIAPVIYRLADGSRTTPSSFTARILWEGIERPVRVLQLGETPLIGMGFLYGYRVCLESIDGGNIDVTLIQE